MFGRVKRIVDDKGYFFITGELDGVDRFAHLADLHGCRFEDLCVGDYLEFDHRDAPRGPAAVNVQFNGPQKHDNIRRTA